MCVLYSYMSSVCRTNPILGFKVDDIRVIATQFGLELADDDLQGFYNQWQLQFPKWNPSEIVKIFPDLMKVYEYVYDTERALLEKGANVIY